MGLACSGSANKKLQRGVNMLRFLTAAPRKLNRCTPKGVSIRRNVMKKYAYFPCAGKGVSLLRNIQPCRNRFFYLQNPRIIQFLITNCSFQSQSQFLSNYLRLTTND